MINNYKVLIDGKPIKIDGVRAKDTMFMKPYLMPIVIHKTDKAVRVKVYSYKTVNEALIRPMSKNIMLTHDEHHIEFDLNSGDNVSLEINGDSHSAICFFVSAESGDESYNSVCCGEEVTEIKTNSTFYVKKDSVAYTKIHAENAENITICGDGIIDGCHLKDSQQFLFEIVNCKNVHIKDVTLRNSVSWNMKITGCENVVIDNVKIFGVDGNNDGIDVCGSRNVRVKNCFIRSTDDCLAVKGYNTGDVKDIVFENCVLWNDYANPMRIGGIRADYAKNIIYRNIDVIHNAGGYPAIAFLEGNRAKISDVLFENIRIEDNRNGQIFDIRMQRNLWNSDKETGYLKNITLKNIFLSGNEKARCMPQQSILKGQSEASPVDGVRLENIYIFGKRISSLDEANIDVREYVKNVTVASDDNSAPKADFVKSHVEIKRDFEINHDGLYEGIVGVKLENLSGHSVKVPLWIEITPNVLQSAYDKTKNFAELSENEAFEYEYKIKLRPGKYLINSQSDTAGFVTDYTILELPLVFNNKSYVITDTDGREHGNVSLSLDRDNLIIKSVIFNDNLDDGVPALKLFTAKKKSPEIGEGVFSVSETNEGKSMGITYGEHGYVVEPILRNVAEMLWTLNNTPKVDKITEITVNSNLRTAKAEYINKLCEGTTNSWVSTRKVESIPKNVVADASAADNQMSLTVSIPLSEAGIDCPEDYSFEVQILPILQGYKREDPITLFGSQNPSASVHMFVKTV